MTHRVLAIDLGGTRIRAALVSPEGTLLRRESCETRAAEGPDAVIGRIFSALDSLLDGGKVSVNAIGISCAGAIDMRRGVVSFSPNLPGWSDIPLQDTVKERYGVPAFVVHDAGAAALGEHRLGTGKGTRDMVYLVVSTGIGGGIIIGGEPYWGASGSAGELGHMTIDINGPLCTCGNTGCLEVLASGTAIAREARSRIHRGEKSSLAGVEDITAETVSRAAEQGDSLAADVIARAAGYLGVGLVNVVNIFNPELVAIGGGVANMGERLLAPARQVVQERAFRLSARAVRIVKAWLGDDAGLIGAALFALEKIEVER